MKLNLTVFYTDGTSGIIEIEKPPGAHPESNMTMQAGVQEAEKGGKVVAKIGRSKINPHSVPGKKLVIEDDLVTREQVFATPW